MFRCAEDNRDHLQLFRSTEGYRHGRITNRAHGTYGRASTMFLMGCLLRIAPVQSMTRRDDHGHHDQQRPCGDKTVCDPEHALRK